MKVRTASVHTEHTGLQVNFIKASRHGGTTVCALGKDRARKPCPDALLTELPLPWTPPHLLSC